MRGVCTAQAPLFTCDEGHLHGPGPLLTCDEGRPHSLGPRAHL